MTNTYGRGRYPRNSPEQREARQRNTLLKEIKVYISRSDFDSIKHLSVSTNTPMSRLLARSVDFAFANGFRNFHFKCELPATVDPNLYVTESRKIVDFLRHFGESGMDLELLALCRRDFDIDDLEVFLSATKALLDEKVVEFFTPVIKKFTTVRPPDYKKLRVVGATRERPIVDGAY